MCYPLTEEKTRWHWVERRQRLSRHRSGLFLSVQNVWKNNIVLRGDYCTKYFLWQLGELTGITKELVAAELLAMEATTTDCSLAPLVSEAAKMDCYCAIALENDCENLHVVLHWSEETCMCKIIINML